MKPDASHTCTDQIAVAQLNVLLVSASLCHHYISLECIMLGNTMVYDTCK